MTRVLLLLILSVGLAGCFDDSGMGAPVVNAWQQPQSKNDFYRVREGDTLYSIAWAFGLDYRSLASNNGLTPPYRIAPGQELSMSAKVTALPNTRAKPNKVVRQPKKAVRPVVRHVGAPVSLWRWPARGKLVSRFNAKLLGRSGIDIAGRLGAPIRATAGGVVVYSGAGVRGYGNLIIVKHNESYLSAYAYNQRLLVPQGARVVAGQKIATMGRNRAGRVMLHFEIRRDGRPVNPLTYLG